ncbi:MAG TPA: class I SAM-dependent methyltransferase [Kofleriaceae bacterium]|nr:class I SAM-dependent methyltransferase [Kofleriaceae bacterium]
MKSVALPGPAAAFVAAGGRDVDTARITVEAPAGEQVQLVDDRGAELGLAVADPDNARLRVLATPADGFARIDGALLGWRVERALAWRRALGLPGPDHAYRLIHGAGDGLPGFACDVLGPTAVVYAYGAGLRPLGKQLAEAIIGFAQLRGAVVKLRTRGGADQVEQDIVGAAPDERVVVTEHGVPFEVHPLGGLNHGLFTDMREHRRGLSRFVAGARVLNLFSYTGALSVTCARAGAATVTSVDTSPGVAAWAAGNFARSGLADAKRWRFETGDAVRFLARAARDKERYDVVLIDPPTFSTARGAPWTLDRDYPDLIAKAAAVIPADGLLWLAANTHELGSLAKLAHKGLRAAGRTAAIVEQGGLPPEYPTLAAQPHDRYLQVCLLRLA